MKLISKLLCCALVLFGCTVQVYAQGKAIDLASPNGELKVSVSLADKIYYTISGGGKDLFTKNHLALELPGGLTLGANPKLSGTKKGKGDETIKPYVSLKYSTVRNVYNSLLLTFKGDYQVEFRAFDDGVAYRFITSKKGDIEVMNEDFTVNFPGDYLLHLQQANGFKTSYEERYTHIPASTWKAADKMSTLPVLIDTKNQYKILISESDLSDYPGMFLKSTGNNGGEGTFPKQPLEFGPDGDRSLKFTKVADYIAKTKGTRTFPWRYFLITKDDKQIIENTMTLKLAAKSVIADPSWIKPGQASWEWWNDASPYGPDVNFVSGYNLETYKYYIDFASKYGIKYIVMDEGWAKTIEDPYTPNLKVDVKELIRYGKTKNVDIILWLTWLTVHNNMDLFKTFKEWGIKGVKIDFMDRSDQWMVNYYENVVKEAAKHQVFVDFHGAFKPSGLEYKYPNLLSYEGVRGLEQMGGTTPENSIYLPFMRNAVGPMDFTPGAMINYQPNVYRAERPNAAGIGTRVGQLAMYVVFESGVQMLADNPTLYYRNPDCTQFISSVPTTWDETKALAAEVGQVIVVAKRKADKWFIGGLTNSKEKSAEISFDFLEKGKTYTMNYFEDGINADRQAMDYRKKTIQVKAGDKFTVKMARNGGFAAELK
ncbi:glycoside hydrolase family 97 protein [Mucilaginibacter myungsuensis]|uniref:Glycoside hydrolase family 97 protein n=1 Tax=Mucilaginibacter myungsuensis TaxID=649104 RepID=A0A929KXT7_9SPHI|nr:glycoside hydrolase family 97 protein [Mucilaginibacter myungsuensis]MBE9661898.1 glycoside hydrolase family 97 protein [Mucilaginibacter myungsuensis]MDN3599668.1 glycoside hydrolase family 97 protein [Mucilaginibacter myungsuensis]